MKLGKIVETVIKEKGRQYTAERITGWINEIEGQVVEEIINKAAGFDMKWKPYDYRQDEEKELLIPDRFQDIYYNYVAAKIDFANQETERYNNDVVMFNAAYDNYGAWFKQNNRQKNSYCFSRF